MPSLELQRQRKIDSFSKDVAIQAARVSAFCNAVKSHIDRGSLRSGCGVHHVQARIDTLRADYSDQVQATEAQLARMNEDVKELEALGYVARQGLQWIA